MKQHGLLEKVSKPKKVGNQNKIKTLKEISEAPKALTKASNPGLRLNFFLNLLGEITNPSWAQFTLNNPKK